MDKNFVEPNDAKVHGDLDGEDYKNLDASKAIDSQIIDLVKGYPLLFDKSLKEHRDTTARDNVWSQIASSLNMPVAEVQNRWMRLRERFSKERRIEEDYLRAGNGSSRKRVWPLYNSMSFMAQHVKKRRVGSTPRRALSLSSADREYINKAEMQYDEEGEEKEDGDPLAMSLQSNEPQNYYIPENPSDHRNDDSTEKSLENLTSVLSSYLLKSDNADDIFGKLVGQELKKMSETEKSDIKFKIMALIYSKR